MGIRSDTDHRELLSKWNCHESRRRRIWMDAELFLARTDRRASLLVFHFNGFHRPGCNKRKLSFLDAAENLVTQGQCKVIPTCFFFIIPPFCLPSQWKKDKCRNTENIRPLKAPFITQVVTSDWLRKFDSSCWL